MKQKWPILIFSALLTAFIMLAGIWGNAQFQQLPSGGVLTAQQAAKGIAPDGWRQEAPGQWHFTFTAGEDLSSLTLCVTNTAAPLEAERLTDLSLPPQPPDMADVLGLRRPGLPFPRPDPAHHPDGFCDDGGGGSGPLPL